jgi:hypothetical protein
LPDRGLKLPVLLHRQDFLNPTPERSGGSGHLALKGLEFPQPIVPLQLSSPNPGPESPDLIGQGCHLGVHHLLQLLDLGQLVSREPEGLLVFDDHIQGPARVGASPPSAEPGTSLTFNG